MEIEDKVRAIICEHLSVESPDDSDTIMEDLNGDSLDLVELGMAMEEEFDIEIADDDIEAEITVGKLIEVVKAKVGAE